MSGTTQQTKAYTVAMSFSMSVTVMPMMRHKVATIVNQTILKNVSVKLMTKYEIVDTSEIIEQIKNLSKEYYGDQNYAALWGCSQALLTNEQLEIILSVVKSNESENK